MSDREFAKMVSGSSFLMDWQKERLVGMLGDGEPGDGEGDGDDGNGLLGQREAMLVVVDHVLWRTLGVGLHLLPTADRVSIEQAVREVTC